MPKGRMLNKSISTDEILGKISLKSALFFTWCIPFLDIGGKILGDPAYLKGNVVPYRTDFSLRDIKKCLNELSEEGLIIVYGNSHKYIFFKGFDKNQKLNPAREAPSKIPDPAQELLQSNSGLTPAKGNLNLKERVSVRERVKQEVHTHSGVDASKIETLWIKTFGRTPKLPEAEATQKLIDEYGFEEVNRIYYEATLKGFKNLQTLIDAIEVDEGKLKIKPRKKQNENEKSKGSVSSRLDYKFDPEKSASRLEELKKLFGEN